jgi:hypothetical protein
MSQELLEKYKTLLKAINSILCDEETDIQLRSSLVSFQKLIVNSIKSEDIPS